MGCSKLQLGGLVLCDRYVDEWGELLESVFGEYMAHSDNTGYNQVIGS